MSNSIGNLKNSGLQGNNFPWQLKMLQGLQAIYDEVKLPLTCVEDSISVCASGTPLTTSNDGGVDSLNVHITNTIPLEVNLTCDDSVSICVGGANVDSGNPLPVDIITPIPLEVDINEANDSILIYGFDTAGGSNVAVNVDATGAVAVQDNGGSLTVDTDLGPLDVNIVSPLGQQSIGSSVSVALGVEQANIQITPVVLEFGNQVGDLSAYTGSKILSISFASRGTAFALVSVDAGVTYNRLYPGETLNLDANGIMNNYDPGLFFWDTVTNPTSQLLVAFNYI